jgi:RNA polymerase sigma factor (sigma-70 family)
MRGGSSQEVVRGLRTLYQFGVAGPLGDEQLLDRFLVRRDEAAEEAFAELVQRHGPMVLGVCRRILGDAHAAEDAFQATFLVLARKAASVVRREKVASWLYGVAVRTAREARVRAARRRAREERVSTPIHVEPPDGDLPDELREILDDELARLPARHRGPVVLCELEGLSRPEAARRLGIPEGTLSSRLSRAKAQLRDRLARRGVALPVAAISAILLREARAVTVPLSLLESTVEAAALVAAGPTAAAAISASVASLSEGVIKTMLVAKLKGIALAVGTMTAVVSGAVVLAQSGPQGPRPEPAPAYAPPEEKVETRSSRDDRTAALEKKLDRVLDALERLSGSRTPAPNPGGADLVPASTAPVVGPAPRPATAAPPAADIRPEPELAQLPTPAPPPASVPVPAPPPDMVGIAGDVLGRASLSDRLQSLEQQMQQVQQRLERLEGRLKSLDARVGGGSVREVPAMQLQPNIAPSSS